MKKVSIGKMIQILKEEAKQFQTPIVTEVSKKRDPFLVLISCLLSLRTKDATTAKASERLFALAKTPEKMLKLNVKTIEKAIYPVGFYKTKARRIKGICRILIKQYDSKVPSDIDELLKLPGVGRKTANIVLVYGYNIPALPIDTHCHRVPNRLGWIKTKTPEQTEKVLKKIIPKKYWIVFNDLLVTFGQNICVPISPWCSKCTIRQYCNRVGVIKSR